jgi:hypothetical protein
MNTDVFYSSVNICDICGQIKAAALAGTTIKAEAEARQDVVMTRRRRPIARLVPESGSACNWDTLADAAQGGGVPLFTVG